MVLGALLFGFGQYFHLRANACIERLAGRLLSEQAERLVAERRHFNRGKRL